MSQRLLNVSSFSEILYRTRKTKQNAYLVSGEALSLITEPVTLAPGTTMHLFVLGDLRLYSYNPFIYIDNDIITSGLALQNNKKGAIMRGSHLILSLKQVSAEIKTATDIANEDIAIFEFSFSIVIATGTMSDTMETKRTSSGEVGTYATVPLFKKLIACHEHDRHLKLQLFGHVLLFIPTNPAFLDSDIIYKSLSLLASRTFDLDNLAPLKNYTTEDAAELASVLSETIDKDASYAWYLALFSIMHCFLMSPMPATRPEFELAFTQHGLTGLVKYHEKQIQLAVTFLSSLYSTVLLNFFANLVLNLSIEGYPYQTGVMAQFYRACSYLYVNKMVSDDILLQISNLCRFLVLNHGLVAREAMSRLDLYPLKHSICFNDPKDHDLIHIYLVCYQIAYENEHCSPAELFDEIVFRRSSISDLPDVIAYPLAAFPHNKQICTTFVNLLAEELAIAHVEGPAKLLGAIASIELQDLSFLAHLSMFIDTCAEIIRDHLRGMTIIEIFAHIYSNLAGIVARGIDWKPNVLLLFLSHADPAVYDTPLTGDALSWTQDTCPELDHGFSPLLLYILFCPDKRAAYSDYALNSEPCVLAIYTYRVLQNEEHTVQNKLMAALLCLRYMMFYAPIMTDPPPFLRDLSLYPVFLRAASKELSSGSSTRFTYRPKESNYANREYYSEQNTAFSEWYQGLSTIADEKEATARVVAERSSWQYRQFDAMAQQAVASVASADEGPATSVSITAKAAESAPGSDCVSDECADGEVCAICLCLLERTTTMELDCRHYFCADCVARSLLLSGRCALCRKRVLRIRHGDTAVGMPPHSSANINQSEPE